MKKQEFEIVYYNRKKEVIDILSPENLKAIKEAVRKIILKELGDKQ